MAEENIQTPAADTTPVEQPAKGTEGVQGTPQATPKIDYEVKFKESSKEALRLVTENKLLMSEREKEKSTFLAQIAEKEEMIKKFAEENPEKYDSVRTVAEFQKLREKVVLQEEKTALEDYVKSNPKAVEHKDSLKRLGRAYPDKNYEQLWNETFKALIPDDPNAVTEKEAKKNRQPESGDGAISEVVGGVSVEEFNKWPVAKRREYFKKHGASL